MRWRRTGRHCEAFGLARSPWSHRRLIFLSRIVSASITGLDAYAASPGELNRIDKKIYRYLRALSKGKAYDRAATESHGRSWTNAQLWKVLPARAEIAIRRVKVVAGNDGTQPRTPADNGGNMVTAPRRATNVDIRRCLSAHSKPFRSGFL